MFQKSPEGFQIGGSLHIEPVDLVGIIACGVHAAVPFQSEGIEVGRNGKGELVLYYSDGSEQNLGVVVGKDGADGCVPRHGNAPGRRSL